MTQVTIQVQQSQLQNQGFVIYRSLRILMIYDKKKNKEKRIEPANVLTFGKN